MSNLSPDPADLDDETPGGQSAQSNSVRGWQELAERRGQELAQARAQLESHRNRLAEYERTEQTRQLMNEFPDSFEYLYSRKGSVDPIADRTTLELLQETLTREPRIDPNNPRKAPATPRDVSKLSNEDLRKLIVQSIPTSVDEG